VRDEGGRGRPALDRVERLQRLHLRDERRGLGRDPRHHQREGLEHGGGRDHRAQRRGRLLRVKNFRGTRVETAVEAVYARGGGVGGTSAGFAIQGEFTYDACSGSVTSSQALADPFHRSVTFTYDFFNWAHLGGVITDQHFVVRDRMGRTLAFLARQIRDGRATSALGVAVNEATSVVVDGQGLATVMGDGPAYFILADHAPEVCEPRTPLTYSNYKIWKVPAGGTFNLANRPATGFYLVSVTAGALSGDPY
jgi:cyanophycinase-like exopeptidase